MKDINQPPLNKPHQEELLHPDAQPFNSVEEAWFWFILAQDAKNDGARITAGKALVSRPCEPTDILKTLDRLYRNRLIKWEHCLVLRHYGRRQMAPDARRVKEVKAAKLWGEAMARLHPVLVRKNIVAGDEKKDFPREEWAHDAVLYESTRNENTIDGRA